MIQGDAKPNIIASVRSSSLRGEAERAFERERLRKFRGRGRDRVKRGANVLVFSRLEGTAREVERETVMVGRGREEGQVVEARRRVVFAELRTVFKREAVERVRKFLLRTFARERLKPLRRVLLERRLVRLREEVLTNSFVDKRRGRRAKTPCARRVSGFRRGRRRAVIALESVGPPSFTIRLHGGKFERRRVSGRFACVARQTSGARFLLRGVDKSCGTPRLRDERFARDADGVVSFAFVKLLLRRGARDDAPIEFGACKVQVVEDVVEDLVAAFRILGKGRVEEVGVARRLTQRVGVFLFLLKETNLLRGERGGNLARRRGRPRLFRLFERGERLLDTPRRERLVPRGARRLDQEDLREEPIFVMRRPRTLLQRGGELLRARRPGRIRKIRERSLRVPIEEGARVAGRQRSREIAGQFKGRVERFRLLSRLLSLKRPDGIIRLRERDRVSARLCSERFREREEFKRVLARVAPFDPLAKRRDAFERRLTTLRGPETLLGL